MNNSLFKMQMLYEIFSAICTFFMLSRFDWEKMSFFTFVWTQLIEINCTPRKNVKVPQLKIVFQSNNLDNIYNLSNISNIPIFLLKYFIIWKFAN